MKRFFVLALRVFLGAVFVVSGFSKLIEPFANFLAVIHSTRMATGLPAQLLAVGIPWAELILGAFLITGLWTRISSFSLWVLNTAFMAVITWALVSGLPMKECGCFGESFFSFSLRQALLFDALLWVFFYFLWLLDKPKHGVYTHR